ncbi:MAG: hypothetical protein ABI364_04235 [Caldimonas sp.]
MSARPPLRAATTGNPTNDDDAAESSGGSLRWAKGLLTRSIGIEKRQNQLHVVLVDKSRSAEPPKSLDQRMRDEIGSRLLVHDPATQAVRNLYLVHQALADRGWPAVEALPRQVLGRGLAEAEMLQSEEPSDLLEIVIARLRDSNAAAQRTELEAILREEEWEAPAVPETSETSYDEYELMERSWIGTVPNGLRPESEL